MALLEVVWMGINSLPLSLYLASISPYLSVYCNTQKKNLLSFKKIFKFFFCQGKEPCTCRSPDPQKKKTPKKQKEKRSKPGWSKEKSDCDAKLSAHWSVKPHPQWSFLEKEKKRLHLPQDSYWPSYFQTFLCLFGFASLDTKLSSFRTWHKKSHLNGLEVQRAQKQS